MRSLLRFIEIHLRREFLGFHGSLSLLTRNYFNSAPGKPKAPTAIFSQSLLC
jgi:hypothetical protein